MDTNEFNTALAKLLKGLKKSTGACAVRQGYRGTGSQKAKRQVFLRWDNPDCSVDVWLLCGCVYFLSHYSSTGQVPATKEPLPGSQDPIRSWGKTPEDVYVEIESAIKAWLPDKA